MSRVHVLLSLLHKYIYFPLPLSESRVHLLLRHHYICVLSASCLRCKLADTINSGTNTHNLQFNRGVVSFTNFQFRHLIERTIRFLAVGGMNVRASTQVVPHGTGAADENSYEANSHGYTHRSEDLQLANSEPFPVVEIMAPLSSSSKLVLSLTTLLYFLWILVSYPFMRISGRAYLNSRSHRDRLIQSDQWSRHAHSRADAFSPVISVTNFKRVGNTGAYQMSQAKRRQQSVCSFAVPLHTWNWSNICTVTPEDWIRWTWQLCGPEVYRASSREAGRQGVANIWKKTRRLHNSEQYIRDFQGLNAARNVPVLSFLKMLADFNRLTFLDKILIKSYMRDHNNRRGLSPTKTLDSTFVDLRMS